MSPQTAVDTLSRLFGVDISLDMAEEAIRELAAYDDVRFESLRIAYKMSGDAYVLLAVENLEPHNGAWARYIDHLKATQTKIVVQEVVNDKLYGWFIRNGFTQTKKHKNWVVWRSPAANLKAPDKSGK